MTIDKMVEELLSEQIEEKDGIKFTKKSIELIHDITKECEKIAIVKKTQEQAEEFAKKINSRRCLYSYVNKNHRSSNTDTYEMCAKNVDSCY